MQTPWFLSKVRPQRTFFPLPIYRIAFGTMPPAPHPRLAQSKTSDLFRSFFWPPSLLAAASSSPPPSHTIVILPPPSSFMPLMQSPLPPPLPACPLALAATCALACDPIRFPAFLRVSFFQGTHLSRTSCLFFSPMFFSSLSVGDREEHLTALVNPLDFRCPCLYMCNMLLPLTLQSVFPSLMGSSHSLPPFEPGICIGPLSFGAPLLATNSNYIKGAPK